MTQQPLRPPYSDEQIEAIARQIVSRRGMPTPEHVLALAAAYLEAVRVLNRRAEFHVIAGGRL